MVSIIVAAYNEGKRILPSLFAIRDYCTANTIDHELIVVDDGSTDNTRRVTSEKIPQIPQLKVLGYETNMGKGYALRTGVQIQTLAISTQARLKGLKPGDDGWPETAYNGDYIADIAADFLGRKTVKADDREFTASGAVADLDSIRQFAVAYLRHEQDLDLQAFAVRFDHYYYFTTDQRDNPNSSAICVDFHPDNNSNNAAMRIPFHAPGIISAFCKRTSLLKSLWFMLSAFTVCLPLG